MTRAARRARPGSEKRAVAYLRCSTEEQRLSPEAQRAEIEAWAARGGVEVVAWHQDLGVSGGVPIADRPGLLAALQDLRTTRSGLLVVSRRDRLARDVVEAALAARIATQGGGRVVTADGVGNGDGPEAALLRLLLDSFAQYERMLIGVRTKAALAAKQARGEWAGGHAPYGKRLAKDGKMLVDDAREQRIVARAKALRASGLSLRKVGAALVAEGMKPRSGKAWVPALISSMTG